MLQFSIMQDTNAVKGNVSRGENMQYRFYKAGTRVTGYEHPDYQGIVVIDDEWILPTELLEMLGEAPEGTDAPGVPVQLPAEFQAELDKIKSTDFVKDVMNKSRTAMTWTFAGGLIGFFFALVTKKNIMFSTIGFGLAAGLIGYNVNLPSFNTSAIAAANKAKP